MERVPTAVNIADDPSRYVLALTSDRLELLVCIISSRAREDYALLNWLQARQVEAILSHAYIAPSWASSFAENIGMS